MFHTTYNGSLNFGTVGEWCNQWGPVRHHGVDDDSAAAFRWLAVGHARADCAGEAQGHGRGEGQGSIYVRLPTMAYATSNSLLGASLQAQGMSGLLRGLLPAINRECFFTAGYLGVSPYLHTLLMSDE